MSKNYKAEQERYIEFLMDSGRLRDHDDVDRESKGLIILWPERSSCGIAGKMERMMKKRGLINFPDTRPWRKK